MAGRYKSVWHLQHNKTALPAPLCGAMQSRTLNVTFVRELVTCKRCKQWLRPLEYRRGN